MNKEETLKLYAQGKDVWNAWAQSMLAECAEMEKAGTWEQHRYGWFDRATVKFSDHTFDQLADFSNFIFPGPAIFSSATFSGAVRFDGTKLRSSEKKRGSLARPSAEPRCLTPQSSEKTPILADRSDSADL